MRLDPRAVPLESAVQAAIVNTVRAKIRQCLIFAIPNGSRRTPWQQRQAKTDGMVKGVPDLCIIWPGGMGWIEVKRPGYTASRVNPAQAAFIATLSGWGHNAGIATGPDEALALLRSWGLE